MGLPYRPARERCVTGDEWAGWLQDRSVLIHLTVLDHPRERATEAPINLTCQPTKRSSVSAYGEYEGIAWVGPEAQ